MNGNIQNNSGETSKKIKRFDSCTVTLKPGGQKSIGLGAYISAEPEPKFDLCFSPDIKESVEVSLELVAIPGTLKSMGMYHLRNHADQPCEVTVKRHIKAEK